MVDSQLRDLAILMTMPMLRGQWMTRWAPWEVVSVMDPPPVPPTPAGPGAAVPIDVDLYRLIVRVGNQAFHAQLAGEMGRRALRDFVVAVRTSQPAQHARR